MASFLNFFRKKKDETPAIQADFSFLHDATGDDKEELLYLLESQRNRLANSPEELQNVFNIHGLSEELQISVHTFKSGVSYLGSQEFTDLLSRLELHREHNLNKRQVKDLLQQVKVYAECLLLQVEEKLQQETSTGES